MGVDTVETALFEHAFEVVKKPVLQVIENRISKHIWQGKHIEGEVNPKRAFDANICTNIEFCEMIWGNFYVEF
jgi:hypothetical protein